MKLIAEAYSTSSRQLVGRGKESTNPLPRWEDISCLLRSSSVLFAVAVQSVTCQVLGGSPVSKMCTDSSESMANGFFMFCATCGNTSTLTNAGIDLLCTINYCPILSCCILHCTVLLHYVMPYYTIGKDAVRYCVILCCTRPPSPPDQSPRPRAYFVQ